MNTIDIYKIIDDGVRRDASDIHICVGDRIRFRVQGALQYAETPVLQPDDTQHIARQLAGERLSGKGDLPQSLDFARTTADGVRIRCNLYQEKGSYACAVRILPLHIPTCEALDIPQSVVDAAERTKGLILVTGPTSHGKTTTLAALTDRLNALRSMHIITLEDPIEYVHSHKKSIVNQREIGTDAPSFSSALRDALREDPDVILVGEMRDTETIATALTAAETGHLVLATLHTTSCAATVSRVIDVFPPEQQPQIRVMFAEVLSCIVSQKLIPLRDGTRRAAYEVMTGTPAVCSLIRENKPHQLYSQIQIGRTHGMQTLDESLLSIYKSGCADRGVILQNCVDSAWMQNRMGS